MRKRDVDKDLERTSNRLGWLKVIVACAVGLLIAGWAAAVASDEVATNGDVVKAVEDHSKTNDHPGIGELDGTVHTMQTDIAVLKKDVSDIEKAQDNMGRKIDAIVERVGARVPPDPDESGN